MGGTAARVFIHVFRRARDYLGRLRVVVVVAVRVGAVVVGVAVVRGAVVVVADPHLLVGEGPEGAEGADDVVAVVEVRDRTRTLGQVCVLAPSVTFNFADGRASDTLRPAFPTRDLRALIEDELLPAYTRCLYLEGEPALHGDKAAALAAAMQAALAEQLRTYDAFRRFTTADASAA